ncbi:hypothetical protein SAMN06295945_1535 [Polynucleobacter meluiroseus]|uniref:Outer membrane protein beta-barrel domain-containing protein n=1 Tax=Polynucleobacter meluiroseus TaxID=1938814 RepID=A0A240E2S0_9BURK|nr:hypothetical protein [Polynucleobacter meluiroseus]SNX29170.1 hypothetical protein SAMN06295945_1535 [Polynucleobacter meluiroseus]
MKKLTISALAIALTSIATTSVMAQSTKTNAWEGAYAQAGVGYGMFVPSIGSGTATTATPTALKNAGYQSTINQNISASDVNNVSTGIAALAAGYNFGINSEWILGLAASYYPGASAGATGTLNIASTSLTNSNPLLPNYPISGQSSVATYQVKNLYSIVATPGYALDKDRLVYAKVGYTGATIGLSTSTVAYNTTNLHGFTVGLGYKQILTGSIYAFGEVNYASYGNSTASATNVTGTAISAPIKGTGTDLLVGIGYRF